MDEEVRQARREREMCEDFLTANPRQYTCAIQRDPINLPQPQQMVYTNLLTDSQLLTEVTP